MSVYPKIDWSLLNINYSHKCEISGFFDNLMLTAFWPVYSYMRLIFRGLKGMSNVVLFKEFKDAIIENLPTNSVLR